MDAVGAFVGEAVWFCLSASAMMFGTFTGSLTDPLFLIMLGGACILGMMTKSGVLVVIVAAICGLLRYGVAYGNRVRLEMPETFPSLVLPITTIASILFLWVLVRMMTHLISGRHAGL